MHIEHRTGQCCDVDWGEIYFSRVGMGYLWSYDGGLEVHGSLLLLLWRRGCVTMNGNLRLGVAEHVIPMKV